MIIYFELAELARLIALAYEDGDIKKAEDLEAEFAGIERRLEEVALLN